MIVESRSPITLVGGGDAPKPLIHMCMDIAPSIVAADGAAAQALAVGVTPVATIGDLDSLSASTRAALPEGSVHRIPEQETTDFGKCLREITAPFILAAGFTGARLDHTLAALTALVTHTGSPCFMVSETDVIFVAPPVIDLDLPLGTRLSLWPMARVRGTGHGLAYPIAGIDFAPDGAIGTSNHTTTPTVRLSFDAPGMLIILPIEVLEAVLLACVPEWGGL